jgi:hypothetical protein
MQSLETKKTEGAIWDRLLEPDKPILSPSSAKVILSIEFSGADKQRMRELASKARAGTLAPNEEDEIDIYGRVGSVLSIWKSKARKSLKKTVVDR